jgi:hypothetical protein
LRLAYSGYRGWAFVFRVQVDGFRLIGEGVQVDGFRLIGKGV